MFINENDLQRKRSRAQQPPHSWHAVSVVAPENCCEAAKACAGKLFLTAEAPRLPLQGCTMEYCDCRYRHFKDRRTQLRHAPQERRSAQP
jgi:hypothetical protein